MEIIDIDIVQGQWQPVRSALP